MNLLKSSHESKLITTTDLALSAFLALSYPLFSLNKQSNNKFEFIFEKTIDIEDSIEAFYQNEAKVSPLAYFNSLKVLKSRIYVGR